MRRPRSLPAVLGLAVVIGLGTPRASRAAEAMPAEWRAWAREATTALEAGDDETARQAIARLQRLRPEDPLAAYLDGRRLERIGRAGDAADVYRAEIVGRGASFAPEWAGLFAARWVRAARRGEEGWVRSALEREAAAEPVPGRLLVLPFDPLQVEETGMTQREELIALGHAIACWVVSAIAAEEGGSTVGLHAALLLREGQVPVEPGRDDAGEAALAPVTTLQGAALRLRELEPAGPPPAAPDATRPERYLAPDAAEGTSAVASALAHFQSEHGLPPSGVLDAVTRQSLERAYRTQKAKRAARARAPAGPDPVLAAASLAGAEAVLTGTIEVTGTGDVRWNAAWIAARDGALLSAPLAGQLPGSRFADAWNRLVRSICVAAPRADSTVVNPLGTPTRAGAILFGRALLQLEAGRARPASEMFRRAARAGAGPVAAWLAEAWSPSAEILQRWENRRIEEAIHGPRIVDPAWIDDETGFLARRLGVSHDGTGALDRDPGLAFLPERGWLQIIGHLER
jgi:hypothetical protein